jgi:hypothetical protein
VSTIAGGSVDAVPYRNRVIGISAVIATLSEISHQFRASSLSRQYIANECIGDVFNHVTLLPFGKIGSLFEHAFCLNCFLWFSIFPITHIGLLFILPKGGSLP